MRKRGPLAALVGLLPLIAGCVSITAPDPDRTRGDRVSPGLVASGTDQTLLSGLPDAATARGELAVLTVAPHTHSSSYQRDLFKTWDRVSGACDTREMVLMRDGRDVRTSASCAATSGTWVSPYDGATWTNASDVDIDHVVPLANAWASGAWAWSSNQRERFANDLENPQLVAVTDNVNQSKGDRAPDEWKPPLASFYCPYAEAWVRVKSVWRLSVTGAEKAALTSMLSTC